MKKAYFDETYSKDKDRIVLGVTFLTDRENTVMHKAFEQLKTDRKIVKELKYNNIKTKGMLDTAKEAVKLFLSSKTATFRACVLPYDDKSLSKLEGGTPHEKRVKLYVHATKNLVLHNLEASEQYTLYMDREERIERTKFKQRMLKAKPKNGAKVVDVIPIDSKAENTSLNQICDLLIGGIRQNLDPSTGKKDKAEYKRQFGEFIKNELGIHDFNTGKRIVSNKAGVVIHFWKTPGRTVEKNLMRRPLQKIMKSRS